MVAIARRDASDDVLFELDGNTGRVAEVHLTYNTLWERPPWPWTILHPNFEAWLAAPRSEED